MEYAWTGVNAGGRTQAVGQKKPSAWGLYDIHGNVWEWVADKYDASYYASSPREDPPGPTGGGRRVLRSGSWKNDPSGCRSAVRLHGPGFCHYPNWGFRAAVTASQEP